MCILINCLLLSFFFSEGLCFARWYMHTQCRRFLFDYGGELVFEESLLPSHQDSCFVTIVGNGSQHNKLSFFFSFFHVGPDCHGDITLVDGIADLYTRTVHGLEKSLCRYEGLDERSVYETRERYLGVHFYRRWRTSSTNVSFSIKFVSFTNKDEHCDQYDAGKMYKCSNGRCVTNDVLCRDLNPCGDFTDACEESGIHQTTAKLVFSTSKYIFIGIGAVVGLLCFAQGCFIVRRCCSKDKDEANIEMKKENTVSQEANQTETTDCAHEVLDKRHAENLNLLNESHFTESNSEINYPASDSEKYSSSEDLTQKSNARNVDRETHTPLKRAYV